MYRACILFAMCLSISCAHAESPHIADTYNTYSPRAVPDGYNEDYTPKKVTPPFEFRNALVVRKVGCLNGVVFLRIKDGAKKRDLLFSNKISTGDVKRIRQGRRISGESNGTSYFCIESVLPLVVTPGVLLEVLE